MWNDNTDAGTDVFVFSIFVVHYVYQVSLYTLYLVHVVRRTCPSKDIF